MSLKAYANAFLVDLTAEGVVDKSATWKDVVAALQAANLTLVPDLAGVASRELVAS